MIDFEKCCGKAVVGGAKGVIIGSAAGTLLGNIFAPVTSTVGAAVGGVIGAVLRTGSIPVCITEFANFT